MKKWILVAVCVALGCGGQAQSPLERGTSSASPAPGVVQAEGPTNNGEREASASAVRDARQLLNRFTWGARPGEIIRAALDVDAAQQALMNAEQAPPTLDERYPIDVAPSALLARFNRVPERSESMDAEERQGSRRDLIQLQQERALVLAVEGSGSFRALLTDFWFNHFNVHALKASVAYSLLGYEEMLRAQNVGSMQTMLLEVARHPAMLEYLDNASSVREGFREGRGLNENYARELLELHTLGEGNGYTQDDVRETARIFTGWNVRREEGVPTFFFRRRAHDTEAKLVMGQSYGQEQSGEAEGEALLRRLADDPRVATRIAAGLEARFVGTESSASALASFYDDEDLRPLVLRVIELGRAEGAPPIFKTPLEYVVSAARFVGGRVSDARPLRQALGRMQMLPYNQPVPTGYPRGDAWLSSSTMLERFRFARALVEGEAGVEFDLDAAAPSVASGEEAVAWAELHVGELSSATRAVVTSLAEDGQRSERLLALLASPEFMVR
ncbi:MAG: DUF1800 domain-containing protein [Polyangiales bacterium]